MKSLRSFIQRLDADPDRLVVQACLGCLAVLPVVFRPRLSTAAVSTSNLST